MIVPEVVMAGIFAAFILRLLFIVSEMKKLT